MRVIVFSLVDDWDLGPRLKEHGHQILAWVRPNWERTPKRTFLSRSLRKLTKAILSQSRPPTAIKPLYEAHEWLIENEIPRISCANVNAPEFISFLQDQAADLLLVAGYPQIFKAGVLQIARHGVINSHPSKLPSYAGPQPVFWVVKNGENQAGITVHEMVEKIDAGAVLAQECLDIGSEENAGQLTQRLHHRAAQLLVETVDAIDKGQVESAPQNLAERSYFGKRSQKDVTLDWQASAREITNLLRALQPWEPLRAHLKGRTIEITEAAHVEIVGERAKPGQILFKVGSHLVVQTGDGALCIQRYEIAPLHGWMSKLLRFYVPRVGDCFDEAHDERNVSLTSQPEELGSSSDNSGGTQ